MSRAPKWIKDGALVWYMPSRADRKEYAGVVNGDPCLLGGHTWCVHLRDMEPAYRDGTRSTVAAAACDHLRSRSSQSEGEAGSRVTVTSDDGAGGPAGPDQSRPDVVAPGHPAPAAPPLAEMRAEGSES